MTVQARRLALTLLASLVLASLSVGPAYALTSQNQCPGDCSPCLGPTDPFCPHGDDPGSGGTGSGGQGNCQWCKPDPNYNNRPVCAFVDEGESGMTSCTVIWDEMTPVSCSTQGGYYCSYITVTP
jgi:hypothetical protein